MNAPNNTAAADAASADLPGNDEDTTISVGVDQGHVIVYMGKPMAWLGLPPDRALKLAKMIAQRAIEAEPALAIGPLAPPPVEPKS